MVSNRTLRLISTYGAVACAGMALLATYAEQKNLKKWVLFKNAFETLQAHKGAISYLGEPIKPGFITLNSSTPVDNGLKLEVIVNVKGANDSGKMYFWATKYDSPNDPDKLPELERIELEMKSDNSKRLIIKS